MKVPALKVLVKLGGTLLDAPESRARLAAELAAAARDAAPHQVTFYLKDLAQEFHSYYNAERFLVDDPPSPAQLEAAFISLAHTPDDIESFVVAAKEVFPTL